EEGFRRLDAVSVAGAVLFALAGLVANMLSWRAVLAGMGSRLPVTAAARIFMLAQLGKYLPGSVWPVLAQTEMGRDHGVPRLRSGGAAIAALIVGLTVGAIVAGLGLVTTGTGALRSYAWVLAVIPFGLVALHPRVLRALLDTAMRLLRRPGQQHSVDGRSLLVAAGWSLVMWLCFGAHVWVLARALGASGGSLPVISAGAYAAAWVVGFLVVIAPAGAGPREVVLVLALAPVLPRGDALVLALVSRFVMLVGDVVCVGGAVLAGWLRRADPVVARPEPEE
ncbi:MAG TPA: lysylphosphatidylglycerol synthase transmembrane domain-containing protein, partial [Mycobacteriales bacterium]|nr:lysylphosphatidylglycerol synthase transmembrane domain-containing protein [Mycobacteriales bacterium]